MRQLHGDSIELAKLRKTNITKVSDLTEKGQVVAGV
jgi:hypothetical protein